MTAVFDFADRLTDEWFALSPVGATLAGEPAAGWDDWSPAGRAHAAGLAAERLDELGGLPLESRWDELAVAVMEDELSLVVELFEARAHLRDLNSIWSPVQMLRDIYDYMDLGSEEGWHRAIDRLRTTPEAVDGYRNSLESGIEQGVMAARRQAHAASKELRTHVDESGFFGMLAARAVEAGFPNLVGEVASAVVVAVESLGGLAEWLESEYAPAAPVPDAVGIDEYRLNVRRYLRTSGLDLVGTYEWGWSEVHRLWERMGEVAGQITDGGDIAEAFRVLKTDPDRAAHGTEAFADFISKRLDDAQRRLAGSHFEIPEPLERLDVVVAPPGGSLGAEYRSPSDDFSRAGAVVYHPGHKTVFPLYDEVSTAYHEGFPGHHLQSAMQVYLGDDLSRFHRLVVWSSGYGEGWALYAEHLMGELGFYDKADYELGLLANQMLRACRVVIDIGSHLGLDVPANDFGIDRWEFDQSVKMLEEVAFLESDYARSEVTRYLGWPAQAISYKVGEKTILDLRDEARAQDWYTDREFHRRVVGHGSVGLDLLRDLVLD